ncbi:5'-nucleotidase domain-containing protein 3-like [Elysia marginata]|uniref:5'-nucleotidase domain-containing protein 3-like n=1 Tax=Elysia marginata TaxID=1093978 RepID=A0AAV4I8Y3_9GAST|nr:5'-nucleotidase domain-containing protein 3-like [Elysia marginata]
MAATIVRRCLSRALKLQKVSRVFDYVKRSYVASKMEMQDLYNQTKAAAERQQPMPDQDPEAIFSNNELSLSDVEVYGFDYDYTLATYTPELHSLIFNLGKEALVRQLKYPKEILDYEYDTDFAVRGLHFDTKKGLFMKIDQFHNIQLGTVYRGLQPVADKEVITLYEGTHIPMTNMNSFYGVGQMHQMIDLFALPEVTLISQIISYFIENNICYDPEYVFYDIRNTVQSLHTSGVLHDTIMRGLAVSDNFHYNDLFFFAVVSDVGMKYMVGSDWRDLFDIVIVNARKPKFFKEGYRPFRIYDEDKKAPEWGPVTSMRKGIVYHQGNHIELQKMTGWYGPKVLYFGDHVYSDLADPSLRYGWRTGAIIPELEVSVCPERHYCKDTRPAIRKNVQLTVNREIM